MEESTEQYEKRLNAITFGSFHGYEFLKYCKWVLKQERQMKPTLRNIHKNCLPSLNLYVEEIGKVIDLKEHEEMSIVFDDLSRLMINYPHLKDIIMQYVEMAVIKYEKNQSDWIEVTEETEITEGHFWAVDRLTNEVFDATVDFCFDYKEQVIKKFKNEVSHFQPIIKPTFNEKVK